MGQNESKKAAEAQRAASAKVAVAEAAASEANRRADAVASRLAAMEEKSAKAEERAAENAVMQMALLAKLFEKLNEPPAQAREIAQDLAKAEHVPVEELRRRAHLDLGLDSVNQYNFAICGRTGTGKSSIINAIRKIPDDESNSAKVGEEETTMEITPYSYPDCDHIILWDIPGGGTYNNTAGNYFVDKRLYAFDCLLVVTSERFGELDLHIAREAFKYGTPVAFVRNKVDQSVMAKMRRGSSAEDAKRQLKTDVEKVVRPQLAHAGVPGAKIFLVSSWAFNDLAQVQNDEVELVQYVLNCAAYRAQRR